jgi:hypothetical protein
MSDTLYQILKFINVVTPKHPKPNISSSMRDTMAYFKVRDIFRYFCFLFFLVSKYMCCTLNPNINRLKEVVIFKCYSWTSPTDIRRPVRARYSPKIAAFIRSTTPRVCDSER